MGWIKHQTVIHAFTCVWQILVIHANGEMILKFYVIYMKMKVDFIGEL